VRDEVFEYRGFPQDKIVSEAADIFFGLSSSVRLTALIHLCEREWSVGELAVELGFSQSATSQHLARLRQVQLVRTRRESQTVFYRCDNVLVLKWLRELGLRAGEPGAFDELKRERS
jgi:ArsR family transcriptional regulator, virulence genes transcriptional regulator